MVKLRVPRRGVLVQNYLQRQSLRPAALCVNSLCQFMESAEPMQTRGKKREQIMY